MSAAIRAASGSVATTSFSANAPVLPIVDSKQGHHEIRRPGEEHPSAPQLAQRRHAGRVGERYAREIDRAQAVFGRRAAKLADPGTDQAPFEDEDRTVVLRSVLADAKHVRRSVSARAGPLQITGCVGWGARAAGGGLPPTVAFHQIWWPPTVVVTRVDPLLWCRARRPSGRAGGHQRAERWP